MFSAWRHLRLKPWQAIGLSALIPVAIVFIYYCFAGVFPFGNNTTMTVDLGQQYVDFYEYFRNVWHGQWDQLFYSFQKGYGGEMVGTWAYYLLSPTLILTALLPQQFLSVGIWLMVIIKIGVAGASFHYLLIKRYREITLGSLLFAISYALMGYFSANQLNIMWLDAVALLPFVIEGVERIVQSPNASWRKILPYTLWLAFAILTNYYMGYMICLFLVFYFPFALVEHRQHFHSNKKWHWRSLRRAIIKFGVASLLAAALAAVVLLPTLYSLSLSKGSYTDFSWRTHFNFSLLDLISKLIVGAFNFDQMPSGYPNIFIGSLGVISFLLYFIHPAHTRIERLTTAAISLLLFFSMTQSTFNLIWHGFQSPIWYPYRYSYVISFFMLYVGYRAFRRIRVLTYRQLLFILAVGIVSFGALFWHRQDYKYLTNWQLVISALFYVGIITILTLKKIPPYTRYLRLSLVLLVIGELSINELWTLNSLSYIKQDTFTAFITKTTPVINQWKPDSTTFYRMTKTFQRTKNDAHQLNYYDLNHFNSTLERNATVFFDRLGQPTSDGFINYFNGTLVSDAFLGVKYFLTSNQKMAAIHQADAMTRADLNCYDIAMNDGANYTVYENPHSLGLGFVAPAAIQNMAISQLTPIELQDQWLQLFEDKTTSKAPGKSSQTSSLQFFQVENYDGIQLINVEAAHPNRVNTYYEKKDRTQDAFINVKIKIKTDDPYYLTLPGNLDSDDVEFYLNGEKMAYDTSFRHTQVYNIADKAKGETLTFSLKLKANHLLLDYLNLYSLDQSAFNQVIQKVKTQPFKVTDFHNSHFAGTITTTKDHQLLTLSFPYNAGWHATLNGKEVTPVSVFDGGFTGIPVDTSGTYTLKMSYRPPYLISGAILSLMSVAIVAAIYHLSAQSNRKERKKK
ncbi:MAG: YfhO family protein [Aerococcus sp.]|nr:YfhO family protein [Aerococcus sp.]